jgi:hypothetical protein
MALHSLNKIRSLNDPLKQFQVTFAISNAPALALAKASQKAAGFLSGNYAFADAEELELRCTSFSYPGTQIKQSALTINGFRRKLGTLQDKSGTWKCSITEDQNGSILNTIQAWCDLIHNPFTGLRLSSILYVSTCLVTIEGADNFKRTVWLKGFYPISYSVNDINPSGSDPVTIDVTWNYDWWSETPTSGSALGV